MKAIGFNVSLCGVMVAAMLCTQAEALERPGSLDWAGEAQGGPFAPGLYVIGDSISWLFVPYIATGSAAGLHVFQRTWVGGTVYSHRHQNWGASDLPSFDDAAVSPARTVFVQLGTNDTGGLRSPGMTPQQREIEQWLILDEVLRGTKRLIDAGKCVLWAGPREIDRPNDSSVADAASFNQLLRNLENAYPGQFFYVDYSAYSFENEALRQSLDGPSGDRIHPSTAEARQAIADLAVQSALELCHANE
jgi:hypothetical protein